MRRCGGRHYIATHRQIKDPGRQLDLSFNLILLVCFFYLNEHRMFSSKNLMPRVNLKILTMVNSGRLN